jgi:hypothetical protein
MKKPLSLLACTCLLSACYSFRGPTPVIERGNVVHSDVYGARTGYLYERFRSATLRASGCRSGEPAQKLAQPEPIEAICHPTPFESEVERTGTIEAFMNAGYELIYADCTAYFAHMGRNQGRSRLGRDVIGPIGNLITGIISIVRFEDSGTRDNLLGSLALATTTGTAALDIYDQHFLFGADNIDVVQQLIQRALKRHATETFQATHDTFGKAVNHLEDNQAICRPPRILTLVRQAIAAGEVEARRSSQPQPSNPVANAADATEESQQEAPPAEAETVSVSVPQ